MSISKMIAMYMVMKHPLHITIASKADLSLIHHSEKNLSKNLLKKMHICDSFHSLQLFLLCSRILGYSSLRKNSNERLHGRV